MQKYFLSDYAARLNSYHVITSAVFAGKPGQATAHGDKQHRDLQHLEFRSVILLQLTWKRETGYLHTWINFMKIKRLIFMRLRVKTTLAAPFSLDRDAEALTTRRNVCAPAACFHSETSSLKSQVFTFQPYVIFLPPCISHQSSPDLSGQVNLTVKCPFIHWLASKNFACYYIVEHPAMSPLFLPYSLWFQL